jgi:hypothetical protein
MRCISSLILTLVDFGGYHYRHTAREGIYLTHSYIREYLPEGRVMFSLLSSVNWDFVINCKVCLNLGLMESVVTVNRTDVRTSPSTADCTCWDNKKRKAQYTG